MTGDTIGLLHDTLQRYDGLSYDQAWSMPREFYTDSRMLALEREKLFMREWICVGRAEEVARPGDFMALELCGEPVVVIHGEDGKTRAFANVCRHRGTLIAEGRGNKRRFACPYHHWSYDTLGHLVAAPRIGKRPDFDPTACRLPEFACTPWQGFVFVSLAADPPRLEPRLASLEDMIRPYHLEQTTLRYLAEEIWETNWKCLLENFMEGYHLSPLHRDTLHRVNPTKLCRHFPPEEAYFGYFAGFSPDLQRIQKGHPDLSDNQIDNCVMFAVPPGLAVGCSSDYSSFLCIQPETVDRTRVRLGLIFFGPDWPQDTVDQAIELFRKTMAEDKTVLLKLTKGLNSRYHRAGPLAPADFEGPIWDFYKYMNRKLGPATEARAS
jgi:phenylpropionate dioxygenase-like ring-hydroxylating dioxygenase large terminal subunit